MMRAGRTKWLALGIGLATVAWAACGDDDEGGASGDTSAAETTPDVADVTPDGNDVPPDVSETTPETVAGPDWSCLPSPQYPAPGAATLAFPLRVIGAVGGAGVEGMSVKVCPGDDLACPSPVDTQTTDAAGDASVTLPMGEGGFVGFAILSHPDYVETIAMANVPITLPRAEPVKLDVIKTAELAALTTALGGADPAKGHLLVGAWDCQLQPAEGVSVALTGGDAATRSFYVVGSLPDPSATETGERGGAGFINVPPGQVSLANVRASDDAAISSATVPVVAGKITQVVMVPN